MIHAIPISTTSQARCLQCQLRKTIFYTHAQPAVPRLTKRDLRQRHGFSTNAFQHDDHTSVLTKPKKTYVWKHVHPHERIVGRVGRRQRVVSERLSTDSLRRPTNIVVFSDVKEPVGTRVNRDPTPASEDDVSAEEKTLSAQEIETASATQIVLPAVDEVNASLDGLRPDSTVLKDKDFNELVSKLSQHYNSEQLARYLRSRIPQTRKSRDSKPDVSCGQLNVSEWRPARTPLEERHTPIVEDGSSVGKRQRAEQILRLAWHTHKLSEDQAVGEIEVTLKLWQRSMLFDLIWEGKPNYESLLSALLLRRAEILSYRPDNIMRVRARRRDAEEIVKQIAVALESTKRLDVDLKVFKPMLQTPGWPRHLTKLIKEQDIAHISNLTRSVVQVGDDGTLAIHGPSLSACYTARRLLLSMLELPFLGSTQAFVSPKETLRLAQARGAAQEIRDVPAGVFSTELHRRHRNGSLWRAAVPVAALGDSQSSGAKGNASNRSGMKTFPSGIAVQKLIKALSSRLKDFKTLQDDKSSLRSKKTYWHFATGIRPVSWKVVFCNILHSEAASAIKSSAQDTKRVVVNHAPGIAQLLPIFAPARRRVSPVTDAGLDSADHNDESIATTSQTNKISYMDLHFFPSPFTASGVGALEKLPRIRLRFEIQASGAVTFKSMRALLDKQSLGVSCPEDAVDLLFERSLYVTGHMDTVMKDKDILGLAQRFVESMDRNDASALTVDPEFAFKLPQWLVHGSMKGRMWSQSKDVGVPYFFEKFESIEKITFKPDSSRGLLKHLDEATKRLIDSVAARYLLEYQETTGGSVDGNSAALTLREIPEPRELQPKYDDSETALVETALGLANLLTRANAGLLKGKRNDVVSG